MGCITSEPDDHTTGALNGSQDVAEDNKVTEDNQAMEGTHSGSVDDISHDHNNDDEEDIKYNEIIEDNERPNATDHDIPFPLYRTAEDVIQRILSFSSLKRQSTAFHTVNKTFSNACRKNHTVCWNSIKTSLPQQITFQDSRRHIIDSPSVRDVAQRGVLLLPSGTHAPTFHRRYPGGIPIRGNVWIIGLEKDVVLSIGLRIKEDAICHMEKLNIYFPAPHVYRIVLERNSTLILRACQLTVVSRGIDMRDGSKLIVQGCTFIGGLVPGIVITEGSGRLSIENSHFVHFGSDPADGTELETACIRLDYQEGNQLQLKCINNHFDDISPLCHPIAVRFLDDADDPNAPSAITLSQKKEAWWRSSQSYVITDNSPHRANEVQSMTVSPVDNFVMPQ